MDFDRGKGAFSKNIKAGDHRYDCPLLKFEGAGYVCGNTYRDSLSVFLGACNRSLGQCFARNPGNSLDGTEQLYQSGQIIWTHIEHRSSAFGIVELWIRMPRFMTTAHHKGSSRYRTADDSFSNQLQCSLDACSQESLRCAS
ncbi:hypothetical protein D3C71_924140 [compost metagenome]